MKNLDTKSVLVGAVAMVVLLKFVLPRVAPGIGAKLS
jgi:hypothetical protein